MAVPPLGLPARNSAGGALTRGCWPTSKATITDHLGGRTIGQPRAAHPDMPPCT